MDCGCSVSNANKVEASVENNFDIKNCEIVDSNMISVLDVCELVHKETGVVYLISVYDGHKAGGVSITPMYDRNGNIVSE